MSVEEKLEEALSALAYIHALLEDEDQQLLREYRIKKFIKDTLVRLVIDTSESLQEEGV